MLKPFAVSHHCFGRIVALSTILLSSLIVLISGSSELIADTLEGAHSGNATGSGVETPAIKKSGDEESGAISRPNILWLTVEDIGPELGCYGDAMANTPTIDQFAKDSLRFKTAWSNYPVCAPARTTIISGAYASCSAAGNMRSNVPLPDDVVMFPSLLRKSGYYCTNNYKEDYNFLYRKTERFKSEAPWDDSSKTAHYKNRPAGQPFFAVFNYTKTHESKIRTRPHQAVVDPNSLTLPPFWPDTSEVRTDLGQYYDNISEMDRWFDQKIKELHDSGQAENTIVFFYGDHGSGMPRFKRYAGNTGYQVAMVVHIPPQLRDHLTIDSPTVGVSDRMVGFVDLAPTVLRLAGIKPPQSMVGRSWFGPHKSADPDYLLGFRERMDERVDLSHCIRDQRFQYTVNYMPHLPAGQVLDYQQQTPTTSQWMQLFQAGKTNDVQSQFWRPRRSEEFYDLQTDPWATVNLIDLPQHKARIDSFRDIHRKETLRLQDLSFIPEPMVADLAQSKTTLKQLRDQLPSIFEAAQLASLKFDDPGTDAAIVNLLKGGDSINPGQQSWALIGLRLRSDRLSTDAAAMDAATKLLDANSFIALDAADCLLAIGESDVERCVDVLIKFGDLTRTNYITALRAVNALDKHRSSLSPSHLAQIRDLPATPAVRLRGTGDLKKLLSSF